MPLDSKTIAVIRGEIGDGEPPTNRDLETLLANNGGSAHAVIVYVLRKRLAEMLDGPAQYRIEGVYAEDNHWTIEGLQAAIDRNELAGAAVGEDVAPRRLVRHGRSRTARY